MPRTKPSRRMFPHRVDVQQLDTEATGATGGLKQPAATVIRGVPCLVVRLEGQRDRIGMADVESKRVRVLFPDPIELSEANQLVMAVGSRTRTFRVDTFDNDLDLNRLFYADCTEDVA